MNQRQGTTRTHAIWPHPAQGPTYLFVQKKREREVFWSSGHVPGVEGTLPCNLGKMASSDFPYGSVPLKITGTTMTAARAAAETMDVRRGCGSGDGSSFRGSSDRSPRPWKWLSISLDGSSRAAVAIIFSGPDLALEPAIRIRRSYLCVTPSLGFLRNSRPQRSIPRL